MDSGSRPDDEGFDPNAFTFDESFVKSAGVRELSASDRLRSVERQRLQAEEHKQRHRRERKAKHLHRRLGRRIHGQRQQLVAVVVVLAIAASAFWLGSRDSSNPSFARAGADTVLLKRVTSATPTKKPAKTSAPLGVAPEVERTSAPYQFSNKQPGSDEPVTYDPCRMISVVINDAMAPTGSAGIVTEALDEISQRTGLKFQVEGKTDETYDPKREAFQPKRYGDRWAPVLIAWSDEASLPDLAGDIAGRGGSDVYTVNATHEAYVTGMLVVDSTDVTDLLKLENGRAYVKAIVLHELGHVVGLDHVEDSTQLMNPEGSRDVVDFAAGDRAGLARLGRGACNHEL